MIELKNVSYSYHEDGSNPVLQNVNLKIRKGECILFCGKSGCGKTTLTRLFNGMIPYFYDGKMSGTLLLDGQEIADMPLYEISKRCGSVFQNPRTQFYTVNTTSEIAFGLENQGLSSEEIKMRVEQTARELEIEGLLDRNIFELSGGEKQIIAFASVYAMNPDIYVLDEPSSNLDMAAIEKLRGILALLKERGKTILIAEHRTYFLKELADRAVHMENGSICREYTMQELALFTEEEKQRSGIRTVELFDYPIAVGKNFLGKKESEKLIEVPRLRFSYGDRETLHIDRLKMSSGHITAIIGSNGAGKSTFVNCMCGIKKESQGSVYVEERFLDRKSRLKESYLVMQETGHQLFSDSVEEEIRLGTKQVSDEQTKDIAEKLDIGTLLERHPMTLSGGQKQRVAIASAFACGKKILYFDEPTSGLDYNHMMQTCELIRSLQQEDIWIFVITHDYELIAALCDSVIHVEDGRIKEQYLLDEKGAEKCRRFFMRTQKEGKVMGKQAKKEEKKTGLPRLMELAMTQKIPMYGALILAMLATVSSFVPYYAIYLVIREIVTVYPKLTGGETSRLLSYGVLALGGVGVNVILYTAAAALAHIAAYGTLYRCKLEFVSHVTKLPLGYHLRMGSGRLRKIMDENIESLEGFIAHDLTNMVSAFVAPVIMLLLLFMIDWRFGLASILGIMVSFVVYWLTSRNKEAKKLMGEYQEALENMNSASVEYIRGIAVVKAFRQTAFSFRQLYDSIRNYTSKVVPYSLSQERMTAAFTAALYGIYLFLIPVGILIGSTTNDYISFVCPFIFYLIFVPVFASVFMKVLYASVNAMQIGSAVERMDEVLAESVLTEPEQGEMPVGANVRFSQVDFSYSGEEDVLALEQVSFHAKQGEITAIVGASGSGKSTIASLIPRFYDVTGGAITIGGTNIKDMTMETLMDTVSFVFQDNFLFKQSILDNIRIGRPEASKEEVIEAAKAARCHDFIMELQEGYETVYGQKGIRLSGGQIQRIAIARAIVKNAPILVLDEATSFADPENEYYIQQAINELVKDKTVIMIAHRLSTIQNAAQILVMEAGRLVQQGTHKELLVQGGRYRELWDNYTTALSWKMKGGA